MIPVILSGGSGSRLWPLSRGMYPKQLLNLIDPSLSMLQQTVKRLEGVEGVQSPIVICNQEHRFMVGEQLQAIGTQEPTILLEPEGRNTAAAIALAAFRANADDVMVVMPADHVIGNLDGFIEAVDKAKNLAMEGGLVTFGVVPTKPETGYGYIKSGEPEAYGFAVDEFVEKPDITKATEYINSNEYFWNGGIFVFTAGVYLEELNNHAPEIYASCQQAIKKSVKDLDFVRVDEESFLACPSISIDYAIMEHTEKAKLVPLDVDWSDVGSWSALWEVSNKDQNLNAIHGDVLMHDTHNSHIYSESKLVATVGVDNLIIVDTDDAVLVADRDRSQEVKKVVKQLSQQERSQVNHHRKVYRPWGWYDSIDLGERFQVKRIQVKPGARLSIQMHHHRAEHWVVVKGVAEVLKGEETIILNENESVYIAIGEKHALKNISDSEPLEIIEVQSGDYLGEDDIVRFEDNYGRS